MYQTLAEKLPIFFNFDGINQIEARKAMDLKMLTRKRYKWDIKCDGQEGKTREDFFKDIQFIRPLFYSVSESENYPDNIIGHKHEG